MPLRNRKPRKVLAAVIETADGAAGPPSPTATGPPSERGDGERVWLGLDPVVAFLLPRAVAGCSHSARREVTGRVSA